MRVVSWFSCGAASAVASKLAIQQYGAVDVVYCDTMRANDPGLDIAFPLIERHHTKADCAVLLMTAAGIELPAMYYLNYSNNNCLGCVKATSYKYWQGIRTDFPEVYERRVSQSRALGVRLVQYQNERIFLDELPEGYDSKDKGGKESINCGPDCGIQPSMALLAQDADGRAVQGDGQAGAASGEGMAT
jgi:hypothetical protein